MEVPSCQGKPGACIVMHDIESNHPNKPPKALGKTTSHPNKPPKARGKTAKIKSRLKTVFRRLSCCSRGVDSPTVRTTILTRRSTDEDDHATWQPTTLTARTTILTRRSTDEDDHATWQPTALTASTKRCGSSFSPTGIIPTTNRSIEARLPCGNRNRSSNNISPSHRSADPTSVDAFLSNAAFDISPASPLSSRISSRSFLRVQQLAPSGGSLRCKKSSISSELSSSAPGKTGKTIVDTSSYASGHRLLAGRAVGTTMMPSTFASIASSSSGLLTLSTTTSLGICCDAICFPRRRGGRRRLFRSQSLNSLDSYLLPGRSGSLSPVKTILNGIKSAFRSELNLALWGGKMLEQV